MKYYDFKLNDKETFDVYDLLKSIDKKLIENNIQVDLNEFDTYHECLKYLFRCFFKEDAIKDLEKCIISLDFLDTEGSLGKFTTDRFSFEIKGNIINEKTIKKILTEKLIENKININRMCYVYYSQSIKYILRLYFNNEKKSDINKSKNLLNKVIQELKRNNKN